MDVTNADVTKHGVSNTNVTTPMPQTWHDPHTVAYAPSAGFGWLATLKATSE